MGESVESFLRGGFHRCAVNSPSRLYGKMYKNATRREQLAMMRAAQGRRSIVPLYKRPCRLLSSIRRGSYGASPQTRLHSQTRGASVHSTQRRALQHVFKPRTRQLAAPKT